MARSVDLGNPFLTDLDDTCEVLLVRHGEQAYVANMVVADGIDAPLSELGEQQAVAVGERLAAMQIDKVYASPLRRALRTGEEIARHHGLVPQQDSALEEINLFANVRQDVGLLDSIGKDEVRAIYREANRTHRWDAYTYSEDVPAFRARIISTIEGLIADHHGERIVIACHGGVIGVYLGHLFQSPMDRLCTIHHTSITTVRGSGDRRAVVQVNDFEHVRPLQTELNPFNAS